MRLAPETIDRIKQATDIVEVIGDYVSLKKRGANYQACCPFHNEKTPSFNVNPARQIYKCFGCGAAGDSIKFVMDIDGVGYGEAMRHLAQKYGIEVQEEQGTDEQMVRQNERESLFIILNFAKEFFREQLLHTQEGQSIALSYFRERGFNEATIRKFELGYSPDKWDALARAAKAKGFSAEVLEKSGLTIKKEDSASEGYDRFRGRVMFPIHSIAGKVIAFGARTLKTDKKSPKYINSPETEVYYKSEVLYGISQARASIRQHDLCYLVEGYTDVLSLHQAGIENVAASSGTSLTVEQIRLISRFTQNITILYDGDPAGIKAALRGLDIVLEEGLNVSIVTFPDRDDPDSYLRKIGAEAFREHLKEATRDFITFKAETLLAEAGNDPFKRAQIIVEVVESIVRIPDAIKRQIFFKRTAELLGVEEQLLISEGNKILRQHRNRKSREPGHAVPDAPHDIDLSPGLSGVPGVLPETDRAIGRKSRLYYQEEAFVRLLVLFGNVELEADYTVCKYVLGQIEEIEFSEAIFNRILDTFRNSFRENEIPGTDHFLQHDDMDIRGLTIGWTTTKYEVSSLWHEKFEIYVPSEMDLLDKSCFKFILRLKKAYLEEKMKDCMLRIRDVSSDQEIHDLQLEYLRLKNIAMLAAVELGTVVG